jgi:hypothetical protein
VSFADDLRRFGERAVRLEREVFARATSLAHESIVNGHPLAGSPGQPVDTGALRASWTLRPDGPEAATISTNLPYAPIIEDGITAKGTRIQFRSSVGGPHSVKLTKAAWPRLVARAVEEVAA